MTILPGAPLAARASEPAATRALLEALGLDARGAAALLGLRERDIALLVAGAGHLECTCPPSRARVRCRGQRSNPDGCAAWGEFAEALTQAVRAQNAVAA